MFMRSFGPYLKQAEDWEAGSTPKSGWYFVALVWIMGGIVERAIEMRLVELIAMMSAPMP